MKGRIKMFNEGKGFGFILGEDGLDYFFHISEVKSIDIPERGLLVDFSPSSGNKGPIAKQVLFQKQDTRKSIVTFGETRIKASIIKNYGISSDVGYKVPLYKEITEKGFMGFPKVTFVKTGEFLEIKKDAWKYYSRRYIDNYGWIDDYLENGKYLMVYLYDEVAQCTDWYKGFVCKDDEGRIYTSSSPQNKHSSRENLISFTKHYLYVTTYQHDNFCFFEGEAPFDIYEKCKELDAVLA